MRDQVAPKFPVVSLGTWQGRDLEFQMAAQSTVMMEAGLLSHPLILFFFPSPFTRPFILHAFFFILGFLSLSRDFYFVHFSLQFPLGTPVCWSFLLLLSFAFLGGAGGYQTRLLASVHTRDQSSNESTG
jgi:hypothetical protein